MNRFSEICDTILMVNAAILSTMLVALCVFGIVAKLMDF